jgi:cytochrome c553
MPSICLENTVRICLAVALNAVLLMGGAAAVAGDIAVGKAKAASCAGCHGPDGISANPLWPNLAGQKMAYLVKQLRAFRDGARQDPMMSAMATPLSDADIENLAAYYSSLK